MPTTHNFIEKVGISRPEGAGEEFSPVRGKPLLEGFKCDEDEFQVDCLGWGASGGYEGLDCNVNREPDIQRQYLITKRY